MRRQKVYPDNRHKYYHSCTPITGTSQRYQEKPTGHAHSYRQDYNKGNRLLSGLRGYSRQRDYSGKDEHYMHSDYAHTHNNFAVRKPLGISHYKSSEKSDHYKPSVSQHYSDPSITDVTSYDESEVSYRGSLVSVASSFDALQDRIQTHKVRQQPNHAHVYPRSDTERRHSHPVYSLYSSDDRKRQHSDMEREIHQRKDVRLHRRYTDDMFSESRIKNNTNNNQTLSYSIYNTSISPNNSNNNDNNKVPLMVFKKNETEGSNNSDVVYIPVVILPDKQDKNTSNCSNIESERVDNEKAFTKRKYSLQHNVATDTIIENDETFSDTPNPLCNDNNKVYGRVDNKNENVFKESNCPLLNNTVEMNRMKDTNIFDERVYTVKPIITDNIKNSNDESMFNKGFSSGNNTEIEKLQGIITYDSDKIPKMNPINVMVAEFDKVGLHPFSNVSENMKPILTSASSRYSSASRKKNVVQQSQSVQVSQIPILTKDGEVQVSNMPTIITKDGEVQVSEIPTLITIDGEIVSNKLKGEKPGIISENVILSTSFSKGSKEINEKKRNGSKVYNGITPKDSKSSSETKYKEIIQEINDLVNKVSREGNEPKDKSSKEYNCCQHKVCRKENNDGRQTKNKQSTEKSQFAADNLLVKADYKEMPKNMNSSYYQKESYDSPFRRLFGNEYKMTPRFPYFHTGTYTDSPVAIENTYKWLTQPNKGFVETNSSSFRNISKKAKNNQTAYPFFTKVKKRVISKGKLREEKKDIKEAIKKEDEVEKEDEAEKEDKVEREEYQDQKVEEEKISMKKVTAEGDKKTEKSYDRKPKKQIEVNLSLLWDYIIQGFNLYLGKTVHTVLIDGIYTVGTVTEKLQNRGN